MYYFSVKLWYNSSWIFFCINLPKILYPFRLCQSFLGAVFVHVRVWSFQNNFQIELNGVSQRNRLRFKELKAVSYIRITTSLEPIYSLDLLIAFSPSCRNDECVNEKFIESFFSSSVVLLLAVINDDFFCWDPPFSFGTEGDQFCVTDVSDRPCIESSEWINKAPIY